MPQRFCASPIAASDLEIINHHVETFLGVVSRPDAVIRRSAVWNGI
jgi:hypothetical protein